VSISNAAARLRSRCHRANLLIARERGGRRSTLKAAPGLGNQVRKGDRSSVVTACSIGVGRSQLARRLSSPPLSNALQNIAQGLRRRHDIIQQPDLARVKVARRRKANTVIVKNLRRLVQERDLAWHTQSLFRFGDHLRRQSHTLEKRRHGHARAFKARDRQTGWRSNKAKTMSRMAVLTKAQLYQWLAPAPHTAWLLPI